MSKEQKMPPPNALYASSNSDSPVGWSYSDTPLDDEYVAYAPTANHAALVQALRALPRYTVQTIDGETDEYLDVGGEYVKHDELAAALAQQDQPAGESDD